MAVYSLSLRSSVEKDLRGIPVKMVRAILKQIESLPSQPLSPRSVKLSGSNSLYRIRVGDYRIIYHLDHSLKHITIQSVGHRGDIYRSI